MGVLVNAVAAIVVVTAALTLTSLDRRTAALLGATGSLTGTFLAWVVAPGSWGSSPLLPWAAAVAGTVLLIAGWSAVRAYSGLFEPPRR
ncbi:hypothetical protein [Curtobacterium pusillum]|uniref:hypothetical protein n=1 Tax=Curtobacterium pusillum TaxID=69373 RepID=UPI0011A12806|nr:hypothetical protein [Curtobacterium pusillum]